jgi:hypothetical protein
MLTDTGDVIDNHRRLLRSLDWNDNDYRGNILEVVPQILGRRKRGGRMVFENIEVVEAFLGLPGWLRDHEPDLSAELYGGQDAHENATDDLQVAALKLGLRDVDEHVVRIRRGLRKDPPEAIGSAKDVLETVFKAILDLPGTGKETKLDLPVLAKKVNIDLGLDDQGARGDEPGAKHRRAVLKGLNSIIHGIGKIRNEGFGTGHGVYGRPELDIATARLVVTAVAAAATFYIEANAAIDDTDA